MHKISQTRWMKGRELLSFDRISPENTALMSIDMQHGFVEPGQPFYIEHAAEVASNTNKLTAALRDVGGAVIFTRHTCTDEGPQALPPFQKEIPSNKLGDEIFRPGCSGYDIDQRLDIGNNDVIVNKYRMSAFIHHSSDIHERLQAYEIDTLIITGVATNACCESSARDASMLGYRVFFIDDATATLTDEEHNATLMNLGVVFADVRSTESMLELITCSAS